MKPSIENALTYARGLLGLPYRWYRHGEHIAGDDKFYASNEPAPATADLFKQNKCIVCTGVPNLMRRVNGFCVPPTDENIPFPGTTDAWFHYLQTKNVLKPFQAHDAAKYPLGTLVLRNFGNLEHDQGHVAVIIEPGKILHAYAEIPYNQSVQHQNVGICGISDLLYSHYYDHHPGYYTHVCSPDDWLLKN
jgi:hypothetical protein